MKQEELIEMRAKVSKAKKLEAEIGRIKKQLESLDSVTGIQLNFPRACEEDSWNEGKGQSGELVDEVVSDVRIHLESKLAEKEKELSEL